MIIIEEKFQLNFFLMVLKNLILLILNLI